MKTMTVRILGLFIAIAVVSCSGDKTAQLAKLKKQQAELTTQIKTLESQLDPVDSTKEDMKAKKELILELKSAIFNHYIEVQGKLDGEDNVGVSAKAMGVVDAVYAKVGDHVTKGQVLAKLDDAVLQKSLQELKTRLQFATDMFQKQQKLWDQKIGSEVQYLTAKNSKEGLENTVKTLQDQIDMTRIKSPIDGNVEESPLKVGQSVAPGIPVFRVVNFSVVKVVADIAEAYAAKINDGDEVLVYFPDLQKELTGKINFASRYINPTNRTFQVEVHLKGGISELKANMIAVLKINDYKANNALTIPINLLQKDQTNQFVLIAVKNGYKTVVKKVNVKPGKTYNGVVEISDGLKPGDKVIATDQFDLEEGQSIRL